MFKFMLILFMLVPVAIQAANAETIVISGSTTVKKFVEVAAASYKEMHPDVTVNINGGGSTSAFGQMLDQRIDIGMMSRELTAQEESSIGEIQQIAVAMDAVTPVVSREVQHGGLSRISIEDLAGIYRGEITHWNQLGGANREILLVDIDMHRGTRHVFASYVLGSPTAPVASDAVILEANDDIATIVANSDQAIAYVSASYVDDSVHALALEIGGEIISPSMANIRSGAYPISRKLYVLVPKEASASVQQFIEFLISSKGQSIVEQAGYLSIQ